MKKEFSNQLRSCYLGNVLRRKLLYTFFLDTTDSSRVSLKHLSGVAKALAREDHLKSVPKHTGEALAWRNLLRSNPRSHEGAQT